MSSVHIPRKGTKASSSLQNESAENRKITNASLLFATFLDFSYVEALSRFSPHMATVNNKLNRQPNRYATLRIC
ncbi:hypothetical protein Peur_023871 [Populus x canadensis]